MEYGLLNDVLKTAFTLSIYDPKKFTFLLSLLNNLITDLISFTHQETLGVFVQKLNDFGEVAGFPACLILSNHLEFVDKDKF